MSILLLKKINIGGVSMKKYVIGIVALVTVVIAGIVAAVTVSHNYAEVE